MTRGAGSSQVEGQSSSWGTRSSNLELPRRPAFADSTVGADEYAPGLMITLGLDVGSQPVRTAACRLDWKSGRAVVLELKLGVTDNDFQLLVNEHVDKIGIDVPLGWPTAFVQAVTRQARGQSFGTASLHELAFRATDRAIGARRRGWPLSVSADRIAYPAMRAARLLEKIDRTGNGRVVEVYPALALRIWGVRSQGYKGLANRGNLEELLTELFNQAPWLVLNSSQRDQLAADDNTADALVAALVARAAAVGGCEPIPSDQLDAAKREGWIAVPKAGSLARLAVSAS